MAREVDVAIHRLRLNRRAALVGFLGFVLWGAAANVGAAYLVVLAATLVGALPWSLWSARRAAKSLTISRSVPRRVVGGVDATVTISVTSATAASVVVIDPVTGLVGASGDARDGATLVGSGMLERGLIDRSSVDVEFSDPLGLVTGRASIPVETALTVEPRSRSIDAAVATGLAMRARPSEVADREGGSQADGTREYRFGDASNSVHWRSSARRQQLVVRRLVGDGMGEVSVAIDPGVWERRHLDLACEVTRGLAEQLEGEGVAVTLDADGQATRWGRSALDLLASLPPHAGHAPRALATGSPAHDHEVVRVGFRDGAVVVRHGKSEHRLDLNELPNASPTTDREAATAAVSS